MSRVIILALVLGILSPVAAGAAGSAFDGTWVADMSTMKVSGTPFYVSIDRGVYVFRGVPEIRMAADGKVHPIAGVPGMDAGSVRVLDARRVAITAMKGGKTTITGTLEASADGTRLLQDMRSTSPTGEVVTDKAEFRRVGAGAAGAHAISGRWILDRDAESANGRTLRFASDGAAMTETAGDGWTVRAVLGGPAAAAQNDDAGDMVTLRMDGARRLMEQDMQNGKVVTTLTYTLAADGRSMMVDQRQIKQKEEFRYVMTKQ